VEMRGVLLEMGKKKKKREKKKRKTRGGLRRGGGNERNVESHKREKRSWERIKKGGHFSFERWPEGRLVTSQKKTLEQGFPLRRKIRKKEKQGGTVMCLVQRVQSPLISSSRFRKSLRGIIGGHAGHKRIVGNYVVKKRGGTRLGGESG